jgi:glucose/arabinose dehydrogenase
MTRVTRNARAILATAGVLLALCACGANSPAATPTWVPQPDFQPNNDPLPQVPGNGLPAPSASAPGSGLPQPSQPGGQANPSAGPSNGIDPAVVATKLNQPTGLIVLPDGTALVGERTTGRILRVQPVAGRPVTLVQKLAGLDVSGDGGLLDLALSPSYSQDGLIYAYLTTATDNRVVHFTLGSAPTVVLSGIPKGATGNVGRIAFDGTGSLLVGTGNAGRAELAADPASLAGKILRINDIGKPASGNPTPASAMFARGFSNVSGLCVDPTSGARVAISAGSPDEVNRVTAGQDYSTAAPATVLPAGMRGGGGCALISGRLVVATSSGKALAAASVDATGTVGAFNAVLVGKYGRLRTVVAGGDGALWITTTNRDGLGQPVATDDRVIRISAADGGASSIL